MKDNKFLAWTSFAFLVLNLGLILLLVLLASFLSDMVEKPGVLIIAIGVFALLGTIMGFLAFKVPQAKAGGIGNLIIFLLVLFLIPTGRETTFTPPQPEINVPEQTGPTGIAKLDRLIETVLADNPQEELSLIRFSSLACTNAEGLGGPPKCRVGEVEGIIVEVLPILGPEDHHVRQSEMDTWEGIPASSVYAVYRVSERAYSEDAFPAGEYAIVFLNESDEFSITTQVAGGKIVRLDYYYGDPSQIDLEQVASEIILAPQQ